MKNILLIGHINSGKTTIAKYLEEHYGYKKFSLGDGVKKFVVHLYEILNELEGIEKINLNDLYDREKKEHYRKHLQLLSTELMRKEFGKNIWIDYLKNNISSPYVIDDIRFKEEYETFKENSIVIKVERDLEIKSDHISEHDLDDLKPDYVIYNNYDLGILYKAIDLIIK